MSGNLTRRQALAMAGALALPGLPRAIGQVPSPSPSPSPRPPDLANLHELMAWLGRENAPRLSFLDAKWTRLEDWKREARPVYRARATARRCWPSASGATAGPTPSGWRRRATWWW